MTEQSPLEKLETAIREFEASNEDEGAMISGAVVAWEKTKVYDGNLVYQTEYAIATEGTTPTQAVGILRLVSKRLEAQLAYDDEDDES